MDTANVKAEIEAAVKDDREVLIYIEYGTAGQRKYTLKGIVQEEDDEFLKFIDLKGYQVRLKISDIRNYEIGGMSDDYGQQ